MSKRTIGCQDTLISCLNHLQTAKLKLSRSSKGKGEVEEELSVVATGIKQYMKGIRNTSIIISNQGKEIQRLNEEKERMRDKHEEMLEALEMLIYQGDLEELKQKLDSYKRRSLDESFLTFATQEISQTSSNQTLNRAFVLDEEDPGYSQFQNFEQNSAKKMLEQEVQKVKLQAALRIVENQEEPFDKKEEAWLGIVYTKNAKQQSDIFNSGRITSSYSSQNLENLSGITITENFEQKAKPNSKELTFSGKKIKSMTLLKEKSSKKKSIPKTSVKKGVNTHQEHQNIEQSDEKLLRKKLNFTHKNTEKQFQKKRQQKSQQIALKSTKKNYHERL